MILHDIAFLIIGLIFLGGVLLGKEACSCDIQEPETVEIKVITL